MFFQLFNAITQEQPLCHWVHSSFKIHIGNICPFLDQYFEHSSLFVSDTVPSLSAVTFHNSKYTYFLLYIFYFDSTFAVLFLFLFSCFYIIGIIYIKGSADLIHHVHFSLLGVPSVSLLMWEQFNCKNLPLNAFIVTIFKAWSNSLKILEK